jgi:hypothetical protein
MFNVGYFGYMMTQNPLKITLETVAKVESACDTLQGLNLDTASTITASRRLHNQKLNMVYKIQYYAMNGAQTVNLVFITPGIRTLQT